MDKDLFKKWVDEYKDDKGYGYFLGSINDVTSYFFYDRKNNLFNVIFVSRNLTVPEVRFQLEKSGKRLTETKDSNSDGVFDKYNSFFDSNEYYYFNYDEGLYKLNEAQLKMMYPWVKSLEKTNYLSIIEQSELEKTKSFKYDENRVKVSNRNKLKIS